MELLIILLLLARDEKTKESLAPLITNLLQNKDVLNAVLNGLDKKANGEAKAVREEEKTAPNEESEGGDDGKSEAIEKFLNSYFR